MKYLRILSSNLFSRKSSYSHCSYYYSQKTFSVCASRANIIPYITHTQKQFQHPTAQPSSFEMHFSSGSMRSALASADVSRRSDAEQNFHPPHRSFLYLKNNFKVKPTKINKKLGQSPFNGIQSRWTFDYCFLL